MRVLVGGVGYRNLRDFSVGPLLCDMLAGRAPEGVEVEDVSYHPVGLVQNLQDREPYDRIVFVGAEVRGRPHGTIECYRWDGVLPEPEEVQRRVSDAVTGVISLAGTLIVCKALGGMPEDVRVVEVEPGEEEFGEELTPVVAARLGELEEAVWTSTLP